MKYRRSRKRALSEAIAALILISVAVAVGIIVWYTITSTARNVAPKGSILLIESVDASAGQNVATIRVKNIGQVPIGIHYIWINYGQVSWTVPGYDIGINPGAETSITIGVNFNFGDYGWTYYTIRIDYYVANGPYSSTSYSFRISQ